MTPVYCQIKHDPENGSYGDCVRACIASIMDMPPEEVTHFFYDGCDGETGWSRIVEWLAPLHFAPVTAMFDGASLDDVLQWQGRCNPHAHMILIGRGHYGAEHAVVICNGEIVHDPSLSCEGIVSPCSDGFYRVVTIGKR